MKEWHYGSITILNTFQCKAAALDMGKSFGDVTGCGEPRGGSEAAQDGELPHGECEQNETWMRGSPKVGRKLPIAG